MQSARQHVNSLRPGISIDTTRGIPASGQVENPILGQVTHTLGVADPGAIAISSRSGPQGLRFVLMLRNSGLGEACRIDGAKTPNTRTSLVRIVRQGQ